ncbi:hemerythrin domain-containing protein [Candidatus Binatus sp.]|uniref:hemerythrin domain-containing protein n=1 Tax=Candidatus Binatus sp. TaxID=2811406 RepID=UPI00272D40C3|nr:hemerythrin domain-containing protein [Candidatus Binatus sp.]
MTERDAVRSFLERDHARLDQLLARASRNLENIDMEAFGEFRRGLLMHIGMGEKILLPAVQHLRGGEPLAIAARLRLDHGAFDLRTVHVCGRRLRAAPPVPTENSEIGLNSIFFAAFGVVSRHTMAGLTEPKCNDFGDALRKRQRRSLTVL